MKYLFVCSLLGFSLLFFTTSDFSEKLITPEKEIFKNPLDFILGEKVLDNGTLRKDNFDSILHINPKFLKDSSVIYKIQKLDKGLFLLLRKQFYLNSRTYSLMVKTNRNRITFCYPIPDFAVRDAVVSGNRIYLISDDYSEIASPWKPTYTVKITCLDLNFQELWNTSSIVNQGYFFCGTRLELEATNLVAGIAIRNEGSSTMCVDNFDLTLTKSGNITGSVFTGGYGCGGGNVTELAVIQTMFQH